MQVAPAAVISASRKQVMPAQPVGNEPIFGVERGDEATRGRGACSPTFVRTGLAVVYLVSEARGLARL